MFKSLAKFSSLVLLGNLLAAKVQASKWSKDDGNLQFHGSDIKGFHISYFSDKYEPNNDYTGLVFYDIGSCTRREARVCAQMKNGYVLFYKNENLVKTKNEEGLNSLGEAALKKFFKKLSVPQATRLISNNGMKMAMFNINGGALSTQLSTEGLRTAVSNSPNMNAYEFVLFDTIREMYVDGGKRQTIMVPQLQTSMDERAEDVLESVAKLDGAEEFRKEYAPNAVLPSDDEDCGEYDEDCGNDDDDNDDSDKDCDVYDENCGNDDDDDDDSDKECGDYDEDCDQDKDDSDKECGDYDEDCDQDKGDSDKECGDYDEDCDQAGGDSDNDGGDSNKECGDYDEDCDQGSNEEGFDYDEN